MSNAVEVRDQLLLDRLRARGVRPDRAWDAYRERAQEIGDRAAFREALHRRFLRGVRHAQRDAERRAFDEYAAGWRAGVTARIERDGASDA